MGALAPPPASDTCDICDATGVGTIYFDALDCYVCRSCREQTTATTMYDQLKEQLEAKADATNESVASPGDD